MRRLTKLKYDKESRDEESRDQKDLVEKLLYAIHEQLKCDIEMLELRGLHLEERNERLLEENTALKREKLEPPVWISPRMMEKRKRSRQNDSAEVIEIEVEVGDEDNKRKRRNCGLTCQTELVCILPCGTQALFVTGDINSENSYTIGVIPKETATGRGSGLEELEWEMGGDYLGYFGPVEVLHRVPGLAFVYIPYRDPTKHDSYVWVSDQKLGPRRQLSAVQRWKKGRRVHVRVYNETDNWLWRKATVEQVVGGDWYQIRFEPKGGLLRCHASRFRSP